MGSPSEIGLVTATVWNAGTRQVILFKKLNYHVSNYKYKLCLSIQRKLRPLSSVMKSRSNPTLSNKTKVLWNQHKKISVVFLLCIQKSRATLFG